MNRLPQPLIDRLQELRRAGMSIAQVGAATGISKRTICLYTKGLPRADCACGKPGGHKGWCKVMLARSPRRQAVVAAFVPHNKKWTDKACALVRREWEAGADREVIARQVDAMLGTTGTTGHAVMVQANKLGALRPHGYLSAMRRAHRKRFWVSRGYKAKWAAAMAEVTTSPPVKAQSIQAVAPAVPAVLPRQVTTYPGGFSMLAMRGPDPMRAIHEAAAAQASKGRVIPIMGERR